MDRSHFIFEETEDEGTWSKVTELNAVEVGLSLKACHL